MFSQIEKKETKENMTFVLLTFHRRNQQKETWIIERKWW